MIDRPAVIVMLAQAGARPAEIARLLKMDVSNVYYPLKRARQDGISVPNFREMSTLERRKRQLRAVRERVQISQPLFQTLQEAAEVAGRTPSELARDILEHHLIGGTNDQSIRLDRSAEYR